MAAPTIIDAGRFKRGLEEAVPFDEINQIPIVDADTHISEPADLWTSRVSVQKWGDLVPHVKHAKSRSFRDDHEESGLAWFIGDTLVSPAPAGTNAGWREAPPSKPPTYEDALPASFALKDRLQLMNEEGVWAQVLYPNVAGFGAQRFRQIPDDALKLELVRAYNDFLVDWSKDAPERFVLNCAVPFWDLQETLKEVQRCYDNGHRGILFASRPNEHGQPWIADHHWDPLWELATALEMPINFHIGTGDVGDVFKSWPGNPKRTVYATAVSLIFLSNCQALAELVMSGVLMRYPKLRFVSVESGIGWVPFLMEALDHEFFDVKLWEERPDFEMLPSEYFKKHIYSCFWFERVAPSKLIHDIGVERVLFETDFPHPTSLYPPASVKAHVARGLTAETPETRRRVLSQNSAELYKVRLPIDQSWRA